MEGRLSKLVILGCQLLVILEGFRVTKSWEKLWAWG